MPGCTFIQSATSNYAGTGSGANMTCAYGSDNQVNNIGLAFVCADDSTPPSAMTDSQGNTWYSLRPYDTNVGWMQWWVCPLLKGGPNTVTITIAGTSGDSNGGPNLVVMEYQPPPCPPGSVGIHAFQPPLNIFWALFRTPPFEQTTTYDVSSGTWYQTFVLAIFDKTGTTRTWSVTLESYAIAGGVRQQFTEASGGNSGAIADGTIPYPNLVNNVAFSATPSTPATNAHLAGVVLTTIL